jgi:hypothetical protein
LAANSDELPRAQPEKSSREPFYRKERKERKELKVKSNFTQLIKLLINSILIQTFASLRLCGGSYFFLRSFKSPFFSSFHSQGSPC